MTGPKTRYEVWSLDCNSEYLRIKACETTEKAAEDVADELAKECDVKGYQFAVKKNVAETFEFDSGTRASDVGMGGVTCSASYVTESTDGIEL